jgi:hypothetical protein
MHHESRFTRFRDVAKFEVRLACAQQSAFSIRPVERVEPAIGIGLNNPAIVNNGPGGMEAGPIRCRAFPQFKRVVARTSQDHARRGKYYCKGLRPTADRWR